MTLGVGILQAVLVEVAADAGVEAATAFTDLVGAIRNAEAFQSLFTTVQVRAPIGAHADLGAGRGVLNEVFLWPAVGTVTNADVFPACVHAFTLGKAGATRHTAQQRGNRENPSERPGVHGPNFKPGVLNTT